MKKEFKGNSNKGGIYKIINTKNEKFYIGSTKLFKQRANQHIAGLNAGKHHNKYLLNLWNKYEPDDFLFEVVEVVEGTTYERREVEQKYVDKFWGHPNFLNHKKKVTKTQGPWSSTPEETKRKIGESSKKHWTPERRKKMSERLKDLWKDPEYREHMKALQTGQKRSEQTKQKLSKQKLGEKNPMWGGGFTLEHRNKMSKAKKGKPLGPKSDETKQRISESRKGKGCHPCSEEKKAKLSIANKGKKPSFLSRKRSKEANSKEYNVILIDPKGNKVILRKNAAEFCRKNELNPTGLWKLLCGRVKCHKGWKAYPN